MFLLGKKTSCCQSIDGHSKDCVLHGAMQPYGGFVRILKHGSRDPWVAQSWAALNEDNELVFDSIEHNAGHDPRIIMELYALAATETRIWLRRGNPATRASALGQPAARSKRCDDAIDALVQVGDGAHAGTCRPCQSWQTPWKFWQRPRAGMTAQVRCASCCLLLRCKQGERPDVGLAHDEKPNECRQRD